MKESKRKYELKIKYPLKDTKDMDKEKCKKGLKTNRIYDTIK